LRCTPSETDTPHKFAGHLLRIDGKRIAEWWMVDAKPAESDTFRVS
jgi:hypothetical protein